MMRREMEIDRGVREVGVAEQHLNRAEVGPRFEQVRRVRVPQRILTLLMTLRQPSSTIVTTHFTANP
jgi:hypothetical protein